MKILLEGRRIFEYETDENTKYLIFSDESLKKYVYNAASIFIKKGNFPYPQKWLISDNFKTRELLTPIDDFDSSIYEYMFHIDWPLVERITQILKPYGIQVAQEPNGVRMRDLNGLLRLEEIPQEVQDEIRDALAEEDLRTYEEFQVFECYSCKEKGNEEFFIINGDNDIVLSDISYDQTDWFSDKYIVETYRKKTQSSTEYVFKTDRDEWFIYSPGDSDSNYWVLEHIYDDELEDFPLSSYIKVETEKREIPEREDEIDFQRYYNKDTPYDFYYSDKMFALRILQDEGRFNMANINGKWERYTEMVLKDEEPFCKWDDMIYVGSGIFGDIKEEKLTQEEIMNFAVEMREKKQQGTTIH
ncbi:hypothetical protein IEC_05420 [Bacillus toyonensis]|uniref:hypothetical protein n=1 Tax=Bacillus toyonensis TaxID=155322 RepID=UPI000278BED4|nr:hypothetical protein [Bacillus toyonensis]EJQ32408.1 hypothetical protein IEC_05420 [Bacillus toyonensis]KAB2357064.1 hypothetical protein F8503_23360 [Bacillus toyonensis]MCG3797090.1 hypothetical protein [Bacillus toyonensis]